MISNIMDNYFIDTSISPIDMLIIESLKLYFTDFPQHFVI